MAEWVWGDWLKTDYASWRKLQIRDFASFRAWIKDVELWYKVVEDLTNGSKHFGSREFTKFTNSYVEEGYVEDGYQTRLLELEVDVVGKREWVEAIIVLENIAMFWTEFFKKHRPQAHLRKPAHSFTIVAD